MDSVDVSTRMVAFGGGGGCQCLRVQKEYLEIWRGDGKKCRRLL